VVNLSFDLTQVNPDGSVTTRYEFTPKEREALEYARQNNVLIVVAAGNNASIMSVLGQASQEFDNIITVGAAEQVDPTVSAAKGVDRANYSNKGRGLDLMAIGGTPEKPVLSTVGDGVGTMAGTSVATAKVTGAASLVWAANPKLSYRQVIDILKSTATDLKTPNWDRDTGAGLLNIKAAVHLAKATEPEEYNPAPFRIPTTWSLEGKVTARERAVNSKSIYLSTDLGEIVQFDLGTGQKRHIYQGEAFTDLAVAPNGKLYGSTFNHLYEINTSTGDETYIGRFGGPNINSLTFSPDGRLYGAEEKSGDVYEISPQTARLTYIGNLGGPSSGDMVFDGASQFFATVGSPSMERDRLVAFDLNTRSARTITELSNDQFYGLAMHNGQLIGYTARKQEIALDPLTGQIDSISVVPVSGAIWGAAQNYTNVSYNPSPSSDWQRAMEREYQDMGWLLGNPTGPYANASRSPQGTEGKWRAYENGTIHWTPQHGAVAVWLDLQREYNEHGGSGGWLGFPTQREHDWKGGKRTLFEGGYIYWDGQRAKAYRHGELPTPDWQQAMEREYQDMGWLLGKPTGPYANASRSPQGTEGKWRAYENGTIHWTPQHGAVAVWLDLQREYNEQGGSSGWLGFPTQRERDWEGGKRTEFEGGFIYWDGQRATAYRNGEFVITKEHLHKFAQVAAKSPDIGGAIGPVTHNGDGVLQQNFQYGYIIWNGQQITVYDTSAVSQESGTENTPISQNQPFRDYVFSSREIDLRTSPTSSNHARSGIFAQPGLELAFEGWTYGETLTDLKTGEPNAIWYKFIDTEGTGQTFWVPSAWMGGFPPGNPPLVPPGGNSGSSGSGGSANSSSIDNFINWAMAQTSTITRHDRLTLGTWSDGECVTLIARYIQDVFMNPSDRSQPEQAYNHGYGTASTVSNLPYFGGYTTRAGLSSNPPRRGAVISFMGAGFDANYGHVGIVTRYDAATNRIYYIDIGKSQGGVVVGEKSISATNAAIQGWTNPLNAYSGAGNSSGGNSSSNYNGGSNGPPFGSNRPIITDRSDEYGFGQLTHSMNFRTYPWINDSTWIQTLASGTTVTLLEKVTTNDSTLSPPTWYKVKLKDGREGYVWADWIKKVSAKGNLPGGFSSGGTNYNQTQNPPASRKPESKNEQKIHELRDEIKEAAREFDVSAELIAAILYDELERRNKQDWRDLNVFAKDRGSRSRKNSFFIPTGEDDTEDVKAEQNPDNANEKSSLGVAQATPQRLAEALGLSKPDANVVKILLDEKKSPEVVATIVRDTIDYWRKDGYDIKNNSSVLATLYSIGRTGTKGTNPDPKANERGEEIAGDMQRMGEIMNYTGPVKLIP
jgi:hypothetical protein